VSFYTFQIDFVTSHRTFTALLTAFMNSGLDRPGPDASPPWFWTFCLDGSSLEDAISGIRMMVDPFEVRMRFTQQLQYLSASVTSSQKTAHYALKYRDWDEDLHSCILEQLERVRIVPGNSIR
jgi:hypothetical protein